MKSQVTTLAAALALTLFAGAALAADPDATMSRVRDVCAGDIQKFCPNVEPGGGRLRGCIRHHWFSLSKDCKSALLDMRRRHQSSGAGD